MSNFAIIPWSEDFGSDGMFEISSPFNRDYLFEPYIEMKEEFERQGHEIHTIDMYERYEDIDFFLFFTWDRKIYKDVVRHNRDNSLVYCTSEPPSVCRFNAPRGYRILKHIFPYILTWNDDWTDGISIFKRNIPYWFVDQREGNLSFDKKKLAVCISGNKHSDYPGELYSERERAISFFEEYHPDCFDLYGTGWDNAMHPCYKGKIDNKADVYHKYRFSICYENVEGLRGYITEKILDCLVSGVVPIYAGSLDVTDYIPKECLILLRDFSGYHELYEFISNMDESTYREFLKNADVYLKSDKADFFSGRRYANYILGAISHKKDRFKSSAIAYRLLKWTYGYT